MVSSMYDARVRANAPIMFLSLSFSLFPLLFLFLSVALLPQLFSPNCRSPSRYSAHPDKAYPRFALLRVCASSSVHAHATYLSVFRVYAAHLRRDTCHHNDTGQFHGEAHPRLSKKAPSRGGDPLLLLFFLFEVACEPPSRSVSGNVLASAPHAE